jgi:hypothetical protein
MTSSSVDNRVVTAVNVAINSRFLTVQLSDGRSIAAPLVWFPRLKHGSKEERDTWKLIGQGRGIHWPKLDEDISVENLLAGQSSSESQASLKRWLDARGVTKRPRKP